MITNPYRHAGAVGNGLLTGLQHYWDLGADVLDSAGSADLTDSGTTESTGTAPDGGSARLFASDNLQVAAGSVMASGTDVTIALWSKVTASSPNMDMMYFNAPVGNYHFLQNRSGAAYLRWAMGGSIGGTPAVPLLNNWVCVVFKYESGVGTQLLVNNVSKGTSATVAAVFGSAIFYIGGASGNYVGQIASFGVWDHAFTATEATAFYNSGSNLRYADLTS